MTFLKQTNKTILVFILILIGANVFLFADNKRMDSSTALIGAITSPTILPTPTDDPGTLSYELVYPDLNDDVKNVYGKNLLKTIPYNLNDLYGEANTPTPYTINAGNYRFVFSTGEYPINDDGANEFQDLQIFNKDKLVFEDITKNQDNRTKNVYRFVDVWETDYGGKSFYLIEGWSGGAHCCMYYYPIVIDNGAIKIGKQFDNGHGGDSPGFFVKNGSVYVWMQNSSFGYFLSSYLISNVAFFPSFYRIDAITGNLIPSDNEFKTFYAQFIDKKSAEVEKLKNENYDESTRYRWEPVLVARSIYQLKAGQNKDAVMKQFDADFRILKAKYQVSEFIFSYAEGWDFKYIEENGLSDAWYATGGLEKIKQDVFEMAIGK